MHVPYPPHGLTPWDTPLKAYIDDRDQDNKDYTDFRVDASEAGSTTDAGVADKVENGPLTGAALDARYAALTVSGKGVVREDELVINVKDYGAVGDGVADDTAALQAAVDALPAQGGHVYLDGTFKITAAITVTKPTTFRGPHQGSAKIVQHTASSGVHGINSTTASISVIDLEVSTNTPLAANNTQKAINLQPSAGAGLSLSAVRFRSRGFNFGIYASGAADGTSPLESVHIENCDIQISAPAGTVAGCVNPNRAKIVTVRDSVLDNNGGGDHCIYAIGDYSLTVTGNRIINASTFGVKAITETGDTSTLFDQWVIEGNLIANTSCAISAQLQGTNHRVGLLSLVNDIRGCSDAIGAAGAAVLVTASSSTSRFDQVEIGGRIYDAQKAGVLVQGVASSIYKSVVVGPMFVGKFGQAASGTHYAVTFGSGTTIESVDVPVLEVDGETVGRAALNLGFPARANVGMLYERNCTHTSNALKVGFFGVAPVTRQSVAAAATDAATTQTLANDLRAKLIALGLLA